MVLYKVLYGRTLPPRSTSLHTVCPFGEKDTPFVVYLNNTTGEMLIPKEKQIKTSIIGKTSIIHLAQAVAGVKMTDFPTFTYTWTCELPTLFIAEASLYSP